MSVLDLGSITMDELWMNCEWNNRLTLTCRQLASPRFLTHRAFAAHFMARRAYFAPSNAISRNPAKKFLTMLRFKRNMGQKNKRIIRDAVDEFEAANLNRIGEALSPLPVADCINCDANFLGSLPLGKLRIGSRRLQSELHGITSFRCELIISRFKRNINDKSVIFSNSY